MLNQSLVAEVLGRVMRGGADFAELYLERTKNHVIESVGGKIERINANLLSGVGIRAFCGLRSVSASTTDISRAGLLACAAQVGDACAEFASTAHAPADIILTERRFGDIHPVCIVPGDAQTGRKIELLRSGCTAAKAHDARISQVKGTLMDVDHQILIANSDGLFCEDRQIRTRMMVAAVASKDGENQSGMCSPGRRMGLELFDLFDPVEIGRHAAAQAITNLSAGYCPAGVMPVAIENGFGGVIFHEACGHSLEATSVAVGASQFAGKLGQKIAGDKVTAIDDGTIPNAWGSINIDDEGTPAQRNVLIENGVLKSYMIDKLNGRRMGMASTGNARRQGYSYEPTSRMTNTFIDNGPDKNEDIIASIEYGLYAKEMGGGSVNPATGAFNFAVREGYIIRNGKICEPVRGASLIGTGSEILQNIDMVGQNLDRGQGMCGSSSGSIPTDVGQPLIRVSQITVGGR
ncbi:MAG: TldD/PmbA family protein [Clostridia bacterium]|nr:TldD/PmbA family protein [Clostridia bacterium]